MYQQCCHSIKSSDTKWNLSQRSFSYVLKMCDGVLQGKNVLWVCRGNGNTSEAENAYLFQPSSKFLLCVCVRGWQKQIHNKRHIVGRESIIRFWSINRTTYFYNLHRKSSQAPKCTLLKRGTQKIMSKC